MRSPLLPWIVAASLAASPIARAQTAPASAAAPANPPPASEPSAPTPPPPPPKDGDFAGQTTPNTPQEDYAESEPAEYHKRPTREYSVRLDALNWLLLGRLRIELETTLWRFITVQVVPTLVTAQAPIALNYAGLDAPLTQHSNGLGPFSGASVGLGFWLFGEPFHGYVIRLEFADNGYEYRATDKQGTFDRVKFTERRVIAFFGSHSRFGAFTFAGGFGLGYELHQVERCGLALVSDGTDTTTTQISGRSSDCHGKQYIAIDRELNDRFDLNGPLHPVYFEARFSIGVVF